jgi:hypothetical protein
MTLNESELKLAKRIANERYQNNRDEDVDNQKIGPQSDYVTDLNGMVSEIAVAKALNVFPDLKIETGAGGTDMRYKHLTLDIKGTEYDDGKLLAPTWKQHRPHADVFLLVTIDWPDEEYDEPPELKLRGWEEAEEFFQSKHVINLGYGPTFGIEQENLRPIKELTNK